MKFQPTRTAPHAFNLSKRVATGFLIAAAALLGLAYFLGNISILHRTLDLDMVQYYLDVETGRVWHPHHLLYTSTGRLLFTALRDLAGYAHSSMFVMQIYNMAWASLALGVVFFSFSVLSGNVISSLIFTALIGFSNGFWVYAHLNETAMIPTSMGLITFFAVLFISGSQPKGLFRDMGWGVVAGVLLAVAVGFHETNALTALPVAVLLILPAGPLFRKASYQIGIVGIDPVAEPGRPLSRRLVMTLCAGLSSALLTAGLYYYAGVVQLRLPLNPQQKAVVPGMVQGGSFFDWLLMYGHWDRHNKWGMWKRKYQQENVYRGVARALIHVPLDFLGPAAERNKPTDHLERILLGAIGTVLLLCFILAVPSLWRTGPPLLAAWVWMGSFCALAAWWEPGHFEFWVHPVTAFWVVVFFSWLGFAGNVPSRIAPPPGAAVLTLAPLALLAALMFLNNFERNMRPRSTAVVFGHWEDIYDKKNFAHILDSIYLRPPPVFVGDPEVEWQTRMLLIATLRAQMASDDDKEFFTWYRTQYQQTIRALDRMFPDRRELRELHLELDLLLEGRDSWLETHFGQSAAEAEKTKKN